MSMMVLGRIVAPFGVKGWLRVHPFGDDPLSWKEIPHWWLGADPDGTDWVSYTLKGCQEHGKGDLVVSFAEVLDRTSAEAISGRFVAVPRESMPSPSPDEFYWGDLIGLEVCNSQGVRLGKVTGLLSTGAHDVLQVENGEIERLIPFVATYVRAVDQAAGKIVVDWEADW